MKTEGIYSSPNIELEQEVFETNEGSCDYHRKELREREEELAHLRRLWNKLTEYGRETLGEQISRDIWVAKSVIDLHRCELGLPLLYIND